MRADSAFEAFQASGVIGLGFPDLRQPDEASGVVFCRPAEVFVQVAVHVICLEDAHVHPSQIHFGDHALWRRFVVGQIGGEKLHDIVHPVDGDFGLPIIGQAEIYLRHIGEVVGVELQQLFGDVGAVVPAPEIVVFTRVELPEFQPQLRGDALALRTEAGEDMVVRVDDFAALFALAGAGDYPAAAGEYPIA